MGIGETVVIVFGILCFTAIVLKIIESFKD